MRTTTRRNMIMVAVAVAAGAIVGSVPIGPAAAQREARRATQATGVGFDLAGGGIRYLAGVAPMIDTVDPGRGSTAGGTTATVTGTNFLPGRTGVTVCGQTIPASAVPVSSAGNALSFRTPPCATGTPTITVTTPAGTSNRVAFRYHVGDAPPDLSGGTGSPDDDGGPPDADVAGGGLPTTGRPVGTLAAGGLLAVLLGAALRLAAGPRAGGGRRGTSVSVRR
ncbi:IPT/TIG domain-containing protein [Solwaraspora sp. WMMB335]|uniref:IPT/TIG domain-containing protein n=1 Tax=Solwaraspora sp. WMMB335 TaxID=3404118 RepID=UPI003B92EBEC